MHAVCVHFVEFLYFCQNLNRKEMRKNLMVLAAAMLLSAVTLAQNAETISVAGAPDGKFTAKGNDCKIEGQVVNGQKEGSWVEYFNGDKYLPKRVVTFVHGQKNGLYMEIDNVGSITKQAEYKDDQLNGQVCCWYRGGRLSKMNTYKMGVLDGHQILCYEKGGIQEESNYVNGKRDGISTWYDENGNKMMTIEYKGGQFEGKQETFYSSGKIKSSKMFKANKLNGEAREFFENGAVKSEATYKDGKLSGNMKDYERKDYRPSSDNAKGSRN